MPSPSYEQNKKHIYSWRQKNYEAHKQQSVKHMRKYCEWKKIIGIKNKKFHVLILEFERK